MITCAVKFVGVTWMFKAYGIIFRAERVFFQSVGKFKCIAAVHEHNWDWITMDTTDSETRIKWILLSNQWLYWWQVQRCVSEKDKSASSRQPVIAAC